MRVVSHCNKHIKIEHVQFMSIKQSMRIYLQVTK